MTTTTIAAEVEPFQVLTPGIYHDMPDAVYHGDPVPGGSLSSSGCRRLVDPSCPAKFRWWADHPAEHTADFDFGHAAHKLVLEAGPELRVIDAANYRTDAAKTAKREAYADGAVPLLPQEMDVVAEMADALRRHPTAGPLLDPTSGFAEESIFWEDTEFGIWRRARPDFLPHWRGTGGRLVVPDYKTCAHADPVALSKTVVQHGYDQQGSWYLDAVRAAGIAGDDAVFVFIFQEKTAPYVISCYQLDALALQRGAARNRFAMWQFASCTRSGIWPAYQDGVGVLPLPSWVEGQFERELEAGDYQVPSLAGGETR